MSFPTKIAPQTVLKDTKEGGWSQRAEQNLVVLADLGQKTVTHVAIPVFQNKTAEAEQTTGIQVTEIQ